MKSVFSKSFISLQKVGKSLMLPIAVLPVAALLLRFGVLLNLSFVTAAGAAVFDNLALIFGIGVAFGLAKDNNGAAGLSGAIAHFILVKGAQAINPDINMGVLSGILGGMLAAHLYNKYYDIKLPSFLGFFAGRRFVPIITGLYCIGLSGVLGYVWPFFQNGLAGMSTMIIKSGIVGLFIYGTLNRLLIPLGLHHVLNSYFWFQHGDYTNQQGEVVNGDLTRFFAGDPTAGDFMTGFFPIMMFALPAAALAMGLLAKKDKKKLVGGVLISMAFTSFLTGITEPIEFAFMFLAPVLYVFHALLTGTALAITSALGIKLGFGFSAGLIDYLVNFNIGTKAGLMIVVGIIYAAIYFFLFLFAIKTFNIPTIGREEEDESDGQSAGAQSSTNGAINVHRVLEAIGGLANIVDATSCITRLRLTVQDSAAVDEQMLKSLGSKGLIKPTSNTVQIIFGQESERLSDEINRLK